MLLVLLVIFGKLWAQNPDIQLIITTPGYTSIYRYGTDNFSEGLVRDLRISDASVCKANVQGREGACVTIGEKQYRYTVDDSNKIVRLIYDRNRRLFTGIGCNYIENDSMRYDPPSFKGTSTEKLPALWYADLDRKFVDKSLLSDTQPNVFLIEAEIDENGIVNRIVELSGALRQYSKVIIDKIYNDAVRGWQPALRNGQPYRTLTQIRFEITK